MNIEEARKIFWLRNYHKTLGELLDEGFLTKDRLEWAAKKAYDPMLKQAARVILESINCSPAVIQAEEKLKAVEDHGNTIGVEVGISLEEARSTIWPFSSLRGQMIGTLLDSKQLSLKDLGYAVETARNERVRQSAMALALVRLKQILKEPVPSAGFVNIVPGGRSFAQRRETLLTLLQGALFGFMLAASIYFLIPSLRGVGKSSPNATSLSEFIAQPNGLLSLAIALGILILAGWLFNLAFGKINDKIEKQIDAYRLGQEGEDRVVQLIVQVLDGNWHLLRNVLIPGKNKADLDLVLVGPPGVWTLEVKNYHGEYRNICDTWELRKGKRWISAKRNPSRQANNNSLRLKNFLKADGVNVFVNPAIIWANSEGNLTVENPTVTVWQYHRLADELGNIWQGEKLPVSERNKIAEKLTKLCQRQKDHS